MRAVFFLNAILEPRSPTPRSYLSPSSQSRSGSRSSLSDFPSSVSVPDLTSSSKTSMTSLSPQHRPIIKSRAPATEPTASPLKTSHLKRQKEKDSTDLPQTPATAAVTSSPEHKERVFEESSKQVEKREGEERVVISKPEVRRSSNETSRVPSNKNTRASFDELRETVFKPPPQTKNKLSTDASQPISAHQSGSGPVCKQCKCAINTSSGSASTSGKDTQKQRRNKRTVTSLRICRDMIKTLTTRHKGSKFTAKPSQVARF